MKRTVLGVVAAILLVGGCVFAATYNGNVPNDLVVTNPPVGAFSPNDAGPAVRETKRVLQYCYGFQNWTGNVETLTYAHAGCTVDCSSGNKTVYLPPVASVSSSTVTKVYTIIKIDSSANTVTVQGNGTETIDGSNTKVISAQYGGLMVYGNGTAWYSYAFNRGFSAYTSATANGIAVRKSDGTLAGSAAKCGGFTPYTTAVAYGVAVRKSDGTLAGSAAKCGGFTPYTTAVAYGVVVRNSVGSIAGLTSTSSYLASDVSMPTANTFYQGPSITLTPGTWLVTGYLTLDNTNGTYGGTMTIRLGDDADNIIGSESQGFLDPSRATNVGVSQIVTVSGASETWSLDAAPSNSYAGRYIRATCTVNGTAGKGSYICALRIQ